MSDQFNELDATSNPLYQSIFKDTPTMVRVKKEDGSTQRYLVMPLELYLDSVDGMMAFITNHHNRILSILDKDTEKRMKAIDDELEKINREKKRLAAPKVGNSFNLFAIRNWIEKKLKGE